MPQRIEWGEDPNDDLDDDLYDDENGWVNPDPSDPRRVEFSRLRPGDVIGAYEDGDGVINVKLTEAAKKRLGLSN